MFLVVFFFVFSMSDDCSFFLFWISPCFVLGWGWFCMAVVNKSLEKMKWPQEKKLRKKRKKLEKKTNKKTQHFEFLYFRGEGGLFRWYVLFEFVDMHFFFFKKIKPKGYLQIYLCIYRYYIQAFIWCLHIYICIYIWKIGVCWWWVVVQIAFLFLVQKNVSLLGLWA